MNVLRRYLIGSVLRSVAMVLAVLVVVTGLVQFVGQLDDVGVANYGIREAILYVLLSTPRAVFQSLPAATLLGTLLGLGHLATQSELVAMRAAGVSKVQLIVTIGLAGVLLSAVMVLLGESMAPSLGAYAREMRGQALLDDMALADGQSTWFKDDDVIINVRRGLGELDGAFDFDSGVYLFELDENGNLQAVARAASAEVDANSRWALADYAETRFGPAGIVAAAHPGAVERRGLNAELLGLSVVREDLLGTPALRRYIAYLLENGLDAREYLLAYWGRWADMVSVPFMALLALPFVFGGLRSAGTGSRLVVGLVIGLGFYVADEVLVSSGAVFDVDPVAVAWTPTVALAIVTLLALVRVR